MRQLRIYRASNLNAHMLSKTKKKERIKKAYDINSVFYSTVVKNFTIFIKKSKKMIVLNEIVSKKSRIEIQISL